MKIKFLLIMKMDIILKKINKSICSYKLVNKQLYLLSLKEIRSLYYILFLVYLSEQ